MFQLLQRIIPDDCVLCGQLCQSDCPLLCQTCYQDLDTYPLGFDLLLFAPKIASRIQHQYLTGLTTIGIYKWPLNQWVGQLKYHQQFSYARLLGWLIEQQVKHLHWPNIDIIVPLPSHKFRQILRGFNQAELLARMVTTAPQQVLNKNRYNQRQATLNKQQRKKNVRGVFNVEKCVKNKTVLLVDDVITTGHTCNEAARVLLAAGATAVYAAVATVKPLD